MSTATALWGSLLSNPLETYCYQSPEGDFCHPDSACPLLTGRLWDKEKNPFLKQSSLYLLLMIMAARVCVCVHACALARTIPSSAQKQTKRCNATLFLPFQLVSCSWVGEWGFFIIGGSALGKILISLRFNFCPFFLPLSLSQCSEYTLSFLITNTTLPPFLHH